MKTQTQPRSKSKSHDQKAKLFFEKLHQMIEFSEANITPPPIVWTPDGAGFVIVNPTSLIDTVVCTVFQGVTKIESFYRSLHRNGITKMSNGSSKGCWCHKEGTFYRGSHSRDGGETFSFAEASGKKPCVLSREDEEYVAQVLSSEPEMDDELSKFFKVFADSITDDMLSMDPTELSIVRTEKGTICVPNRRN